MKNNQLQKHDDAGRIAAAMEAIRGGPGNRAQENYIMRPPEPETFKLPCVCGWHDKPYTLVFTRQPSGLLRYSESIREEGRAVQPGQTRASGVSTLRLDRFEAGRAPCPWCGDASFHHCSQYCGAFVCGARMVGNTFHCRPSCDASWVGVPLQEVQGMLQEQRRQFTAAPPRPVVPMGPRPSLYPVQRPAVAAGGKPALLLSAGKNR